MVYIISPFFPTATDLQRRLQHDLYLIYRLFSFSVCFTWDQQTSIYHLMFINVVLTLLKYLISYLWYTVIIYLFEKTSIHSSTLCLSVYYVVQTNKKEISEINIVFAAFLFFLRLLFLRTFSPWCALVSRYVRVCWPPLHWVACSVDIIVFEWNCLCTCCTRTRETCYSTDHHSRGRFRYPVTPLTPNHPSPLRPTFFPFPWARTRMGWDGECNLGCTFLVRDLPSSDGGIP